MTKDIAGMIPLLGAMIESTTGMKLREMIGGLGNGSGSAHSGDDAGVVHEPVVPTPPVMQSEAEHEIAPDPTASKLNGPEPRAAGVTS